MSIEMYSEGCLPWWRGRHTIDGDKIRLTSTPEPYDIGRGSEAGNPPYTSLLRLAHRASYDRVHSPDARTTDEILTWCNRYGLLGLLLQQTVLVRPWPQWMPRTDPGGERGLLIPGRIGHASSRLVPIAQQFVRDGSLWRASHEVLHPNKPSTAAPTKPRPVDLGEVSDWRVPGVAVVGVEGGQSWEPIASAWGRFFPSISEQDRERYPYPRPLSPAFWQHYAEPVADFLKAANALRDYVAALRSESSSVDRTVRPERTPPVQRRSGLTPSLLAMLYAMVDEDIAAGYHAAACAECGSPFLSETRRTQYCSPTCRNTATVRAYRHRHKNARRRPPHP